jgi:NAD(P)-dependent dehydrogenase (short-subunit alcohol dehydrogenase family)
MTRKTVLITGTSSGIGMAAVRHFALHAWNVIATMRDISKGAELERINALVTKLDVQNRDSIEAAIDKGIERFGRIDVVVNNAGYGQYGLFEAISREKIQQQFDVNLFGVMDVTRAILPHFRDNQAGIIINVSSGAGIFTLPMISLYCASKFALEGFSEALAFELASQNIIVKIVEPHGGVRHTDFPSTSARENADDALLMSYRSFVRDMNMAYSNMPPGGRMITAEEVAQEIYRAATDGTNKLRYPIGDDTRGFLKARREQSEEAYMALIRSRFPRRD